MDNASKAAKLAYQKAWRKAHPEKVREYDERYWAKKAAQIKECSDQEQEDETNE